MGLTSFAGELPALKYIGIAKNYLEVDKLAREREEVNLMLDGIL